ncbi:hypothetical protein DBB29_24625 [Pandoraea cepalis]|uniref:Uncharacterized protein n=2 Tax=Pandoraea cepalis TaxID=2508294 RepID=A0AAW7MGI6_9BURK|nr:hypothetical protein [Pandoraea cepalis]MDN4581301.1 hypothetical protein [Pandoraea cepalis]
MGGRHENGKIYCGYHNEGYSPLVAPLAEQFSFFNMELAVVPDRAKAPKSILVDVRDGPKQVKLTAEASLLTQPMLIYRETLPEGTALNMGFATRGAGRDWIAKLQAQAALVSTPPKGVKAAYLLPEVRISLHFDRTTHAALAYIAQTHFAEQFPETVRTPEFRPFIDFTWAAAQLERARGRARGALAKAGQDPKSAQLVDSDADVKAAQAALDASLTPFGGNWPVSWRHPVTSASNAAQPDPHASPNAYAFGHRVTVGIDVPAGATRGVAYARVSLFSTFHVTVTFAQGVPASAAREVSIDIDPLAAGFPNDRTIVERTNAASRREVGAATKDPDVVRQELASMQAGVGELLGRMREYALAATVQDEHAQLTEAIAGDADQLASAVKALVDRQIQRVWNLVTFGIDGLKAQPQLARGMAALLDGLVARDKTSPSGLSQGAEASLLIARHALEAQLIADFSGGTLDAQRLSDLLHGAQGVQVVLPAVLAPLIAQLPA